MGPGKVNGLIAQFLERVGLTSGGVAVAARDPTVTSVTSGTGSPATMVNGGRYNNAGTAVKSGLVLPNEPTVGNHLWVSCLNSNGLRITAPTGHTIQLGELTTATGGYVETVRVGSAVHLVCTSSTTWVADEVSGTWRADSTTSAGFAYTPTPWTTFTPTGSWSTNTTYTGTWRQVGNVWQAHYCLTLSGAPTSANLTVELPSGFLLATTAAAGWVGSTNYVGFGEIYDAGTASRPGCWGQMSSGDNNTITVLYTSAVTSAANVTQAAPQTFANLDEVRLWVEIPVQ